MYGFLQESYKCAVSGEVPQSRQLQVYSLAQRETQPNNLRGKRTKQLGPKSDSWLSCYRPLAPPYLFSGWEKLSYTPWSFREGSVK